MFDIIKYAKDKDKIKKLIKEETAYQHMAKDAYEVIAAFTKSKELMEMEEKWEGEKIDMCKALQDWAAERANISLEEFESLYQDYLKQNVA